MENKREFKLPQTLRELMRKNPVTGEKTTMKKLAEAVGVRQKTVPLYCSGQTVPTAKLCPATADYFGVSADYLLIGREDGDLYFLMVDAQRRKVYEKLGSIAVLCSNAENLALSLMESGVKPDAQGQRGLCRPHCRSGVWKHRPPGTGGKKSHRETKKEVLPENLCLLTVCGRYR